MSEVTCSNFIKSIADPTYPPLHLRKINVAILLISAALVIYKQRREYGHRCPRTFLLLQGVIQTHQTQIQTLLAR